MTSPVQVAFVQGVQTPDTIINPPLFYKLTRRMRFAAQSATAIAFASSNQVQLKKTGVVSALEIRVSGNVVIGGTIGTTTASYEWPYDLLKGLKLSVNGQSTLIDVRGLDLKVNEVMTEKEVNDRGVAQRVGNATAIQQGTLSMSHEDWGGTGAAANFIAPGLNVAAIQTYPIELTYVVPVAADFASLVGSVFGQSQATNINVEAIWASQTDIFSAFGGAATLTTTGVTFDVTAVAYSIPVVDGKAILPDLSNLHGLNHVQLPLSSSGDTELLLPGTGAGRYMLRTFFNVYTGSPLVPLAMTSANFGNLGYKFGANDVPELFPNGSKLRAKNERDYNSDIGKAWGFACHDFASQYALRDVIDLGTTSDFRLLINLVATPTNGQAHVTQETLFLATVGA
jgi:hypothetical protein